MSIKRLPATLKPIRTPLKAFALTAILVAPLALAPVNSSAQETAFGKNKVKYRDFQWRYIQSRHFDVYFYDTQYDLAKYAAETLEDAYIKVSDELDYRLRSRIPVFIYLSPNDFQTTNITPGIMPEGVNGFTEVFKKRVVVHFNGSYADFRHLLHHELTHAVVYDLIFGSSFSSVISRQRLFDLPLWFAEGYAEYSSRGNWFYQSDMIVRDATINNYLRPPGYMGILAYTVGAGLINYIAKEYGEEKLGDILRKGKATLSIERAIKSSLGIPMEKLWADYNLALKQRYWPEIAERKTTTKAAKQLTKHGRDGSFFNEKPAFSPKGDRIAMFSDRSDYTEIFLISAKDGRVISKVTKASRSGDLESLHSFFSGISFSPDGDSLCFVAKSNGKDALFFMNLRKKKIYHKKRIDANGLLSPVWSPDGEKVAFSALMRGQRDLFIYNMRKDQLIQVTDDVHDDREASWMPDSKNLVFSSDRPHPETNVERDVQFDKTGTFFDEDGNTLGYGGYNLFTLNVETREMTPLRVGDGKNIEPSVSPDGKKLVFVSNRNGIDNLYLHYFDSTGAIAITDLLTGAGSPSWNPNGREIAFSSFNEGGFDVFILKDILPQGMAGILEPTGFYAGRYDGSFNELALGEDRVDTTAIIWSPKTLGWEDDEGDGGEQKSLVATDDSTGGTKVINATESGITDDGDYVVVSDKDDSDNEGEATAGEIEDALTSPETDPMDAHLTDVPDDDVAGHRRNREPVEAPKPENNMIDGQYVTQPYKVKFTTDFVAAGANFDTFFGLQGSSFISLSDYLGNHQIFLAIDAFGSLDQTNVQAFYFNNKRRTRYGGGFFHTKNFYLDNGDINGFNNRLFSDRFYGAQGYLSYPFSTFSRFDLIGSLTFIDREYSSFDDLRGARTTRATSLAASYTHDNVLWGFTGPVNGSRSKLTLTASRDFFSDAHMFYREGLDSSIVANPDSTVDALSYVSAEIDYRKYWHIHRSFSAAFRFSGGASFGRTPKRYFLGGTTNWIGNRVDNAEVFDVENLYFADIVTPLRGFDYYELSGSRYFLTNVEFRYPFLDYIQLHFPLPLALGNVQGATFFDFGATWDGSDFKFATSQGGTHLVDAKAGFGWGLRMNLGFLLLRYDMAWQTDFRTVGDKPQQYFSFGADF